MNVVRDTEVTTKELTVFFLATLVLSNAYVLFSGPMVEPGAGLEKAMEWYGGKAMVIVWAPMLFALLTALTFRGKAGLMKILRRLTIWNVGSKWWLAAILIPVAIHLTAAVLAGLDGEPSASVVFSDWAAAFPASFLFLFALIIGEELGWRGYAQPALQARMTPFVASIVLGLVWGAWHYGVWYGQNLGMTGSESAAIQFLLVNTGFTIVVSLILAWFCNNTRASILIAMAYHAANNASMRIDAFQSDDFLINYTVTAVVAVALVLLNRKMFFEDPD